MSTENNNEQNSSYVGACMEVAGLESCGMGFSAPEVKPCNNTEVERGD